MGIASRARAILASPRSEWLKIEAESTPPAELFRDYAVPLAAIGPIASFVGLSVFGLRIPFAGVYRISAGWAFGHAVVRYVLSLVAVWILAFVVDRLAPTFGGRRDFAQAFKVAVYSSTAPWIAGAFALFPPLAILGILGLYGVYLLYLGLPALMKAPASKAAGYAIVVLVAAAVLWMIFTFATRPLLPVPPGSFRFVR